MRLQIYEAIVAIFWQSVNCFDYLGQLEKLFNLVIFIETLNYLIKKIILLKNSRDTLISHENLNQYNATASVFVYSPEYFLVTLYAAHPQNDLSSLERLKLTSMR